MHGDCCTATRRADASAIVMTWGPGQGTAVHDHGGLWCVEGVVDGEIAVTQYDLVEQTHDAYRFEAKGCVHAAVGSAGCLIPPFDYHILANAIDQPSITLHVYGGDLDDCKVFLPATPDGRYAESTKMLSFHE
jgi:predicted metal-dependent enzyme (double-stranded beta helix superfamily)